MKLLKSKVKKILKTAGENIVILKGTPIELSVDFLGETLQARGQWNDIQSIKRKKIDNQE